MAILFTLGLVALTIAWYFHYARERIQRSGAILHTFARLGAQRYGGLDVELREIVREKGLREEDPYDQVVARAPALLFDDAVSFEEVVDKTVSRLAEVVELPVETIREGIERARSEGLIPMGEGVALLHWREEELERPTMLLVRLGAGLDLGDPSQDGRRGDGLRGIITLMSREEDPGQHLRLLGHLATRVDDPSFLAGWEGAQGPDGLRGLLMREERTLTVQVGSDDGTDGWVGRPLRSMDLPPQTLVALIRRGGESIVPNGETVLAAGDRVIVIGTPEGIETIVGGRQQS